MKNKILYFLLLIILASCSPRNLVYLSDLEEEGVYQEKITNVSQPKVQADDLLSITISSLNPESNILFNNGVLLTGGGGGNNVTAAAQLSEGYVVDKDGFVNFPIVGKIQLAGLTKEEATLKITAIMQEYIKKPIVDVRYLNFKVTVVGEVSSPSTFTIPTGRINIIEALGFAGDMTTLGKRENVMIIREEGGVRSIARVNLNSKDILNSPYFYLQQNDIVYVEPDKAKAAQASMTRSNISFGLSIISVVVIVLTRLL